MPIFIKTISFSTSGKFNTKKDDPLVNAVLIRLQEQGAKIIDIKLSLGGAFLSGIAASYLITYESTAPID